MALAENGATGSTPGTDNELKLFPIVHPKNHVLPTGARWLTGYAMVIKSPDGGELSMTSGFETRSSTRRCALIVIGREPEGTKIEVVRKCMTDDGRILRRVQELVELAADFA